jgi:hypothetical protein
MLKLPTGLEADLKISQSKQLSMDIKTTGYWTK